MHSRPATETYYFNRDDGQTTRTIDPPAAYVRYHRITSPRLRCAGAASSTSRPGFERRCSAGPRRRRRRSLAPRCSLWRPCPSQSAASEAARRDPPAAASAASPKTTAPSSRSSPA
eukprot:31312-Pelagococcus_subviridis.AAC.5